MTFADPPLRFFNLKWQCLLFAVANRTRQFPNQSNSQVVSMEWEVLTIGHDTFWAPDFHILQISCSFKWALGCSSTSNPWLSFSACIYLTITTITSSNIRETFAKIRASNRHEQGKYMHCHLKINWSSKTFFSLKWHVCEDPQTEESNTEYDKLIWAIVEKENVEGASNHPKFVCTRMKRLIKEHPSPFLWKSHPWQTCQEALTFSWRSISMLHSQFLVPYTFILDIK